MSGLPHLAQLDDICAFGRQTISRSMLPVLVRRIIFQLNDSVSTLQIAGEEDTDLSGYDGIVCASHGDFFVPEGRSVWEFGTSSKPADKAEKDYEKRTADPLKEECSNTTFVFVTPHRWSKAKEWAKKKCEEGIWKEVRAYTANDIMEAIEETPAVHLWFSELVNKPATGAMSLETWWNKYRQPTKGLLTPELVLSGREDATSQLLRTIVDHDRSHLWVKAATTDDVLAFVAATLILNKHGNRDDLLSRAIVVNEPGVLRYLDNAANLLILLPFSESLVREADLVTEHDVILIADSMVTANICLPPIPIETAQELFERQSVPKEDAIAYARAIYRSVPKFRSAVAQLKISNSIFVHETEQTSKIVRRIWLLGAWNDNRQGDIQVVKSLTASSKDVIEPALMKYSSGADPIFSKIGSTWAVISPSDSADRLVSSVTNVDLLEFENTIQVVLGAIDPALTLPAKDRWAANIYGKSRQHSSDLRNGIATSLALFGSLKQTVPNQTSWTFRGWAAQIVRAILKRANEDSSGDLWISLTNLLPKLAEAAPDLFMNELQKAIKPNGSLRARVFEESSGPLTPSSPHVYILWALERLAWNADYFGSATQFLALLADMDPGGKLSNRPINSLTSILCSWHPQTTVSREDRNKIVSIICHRFPSVGSQLVLSLIPKPGETMTDTAAPEFQPWKVTPQVSTAELFEDVKFYTDLAMRQGAKDPTIWVKLISKLPSLPTDIRNTALDTLQKQPDIPTTIRNDIWSKLTDLIHRHEQFADSDWALSREQLGPFCETARLMAPTDVVKRVEWLFDYTPFVPATLSERGEDSTNNNVRVINAQKQAIHDVFDEEGLNSVIRLVRVVKQPWAVGDVFAQLNLNVPCSSIAKLLDDESTEVRNFAFSALARITNRELDQLLKLVDMSDMSVNVKARLLLIASDLQSVWPALSGMSKDIENTYWSEFPIVGRGNDFKLVNETAKELSRHGRTAAALDMMAMYSYSNKDSIDPKIIVDLLQRLMEAPDPETKALPQYDIEQLLGLIRSDPSISDDRVATLEWAFMPTLQGKKDSISLQHHLAEQPSFFVDVVSLVFRSTQTNDNGKSKISEVHAMNAWRLLHSWTTVPGTDYESGAINEDRLLTWTTEARTLLSQCGRSDVGDSCIGQVLANAPGDEDGTWPCKPVRDLIEDLDSENLNTGFVTGIQNKRGVSTRALDEGGDQEYELERKYNKLAESLNLEWPIVARLLRSVSNSYHAEGVHNDEEAQRFREGFDR